MSRIGPRASPWPQKQITCRMPAVTTTPPAPSADPALLQVPVHEDDLSYEEESSSEEEEPPKPAAKPRAPANKKRAAAKETQSKKGNKKQKKEEATTKDEEGEAEDGAADKKKKKKAPAVKSPKTIRKRLLAQREKLQEKLDKIHVDLLRVEQEIASAAGPALE